jgi:hypothetical protein
MKNYFLPIVFLFFAHGSFAMEQEDGFRLDSDADQVNTAIVDVDAIDSSQRANGTSKAMYVWTKKDKGNLVSKDAEVDSNTQATHFIRALFTSPPSVVLSRKRGFENLQAESLIVNGVMYTSRKMEQLLQPNGEIVKIKQDYESRVVMNAVKFGWFFCLYKPHAFTTTAKIHYYKEVEKEQINLDVTIEKRKIEPIPGKSFIKLTELGMLSTLVAATGAAVMVWKYIKK